VLLPGASSSLNLLRYELFLSILTSYGLVSYPVRKAFCVIRFDRFSPSVHNVLIRLIVGKSNVIRKSGVVLGFMLGLSQVQADYHLEDPMKIYD
jgi:hypothetical protein